MLSQVHVALDIVYQHIVHVYTGVVYNHHICLCDFHMIVLVAYVVVLVVFLCIGICHKQRRDWREILRLSSRPCSPSLTF